MKDVLLNSEQVANLLIISRIYCRTWLWFAVLLLISGRHSCTCSHYDYSLDSRAISECKVPSSPYKRGREGTCKGIHNF
jgi:hypothetical protein